MARHLLRVWRTSDRLLVHLTRFVLASIGMTVLIFVSLAIIGRYAADFPVLFLEAMSRLLFTWFCLLGAGLALREKMHVGIELLRQKLPPRWGKLSEFLAHGCVLFLLLLLLSGSPSALVISASQTDPSLGFSFIWAMLSVPVGVVLMIYHQLCLILESAGISQTG